MGLRARCTARHCCGLLASPDQPQLETRIEQRVRLPGDTALVGPCVAELTWLALAQYSVNAER